MIVVLTGGEKGTDVIVAGDHGAHMYSSPNIPSLLYVQYSGTLL